MHVAWCNRRSEAKRGGQIIPPSLPPSLPTYLVADPLTPVTCHLLRLPILSV